MPDPNGLQYMPGGKLYGLNSPFITSNNPPQPSTDNKLGYLGMSGKNSFTYTDPPPGTATVDNPGVFVASQPLVERTDGVRSANMPGGGSFGFNPVAQAPGNGGINNGAGNSFGFNPVKDAPGNTATTTTSNASNNSYGFNPIAGASTVIGNKKNPYQQSSSLPMPDTGTIAPRGNGGYRYSSIVDAMAQQQQPQFSQFAPLHGLFRTGAR